MRRIFDQYYAYRPWSEDRRKQHSAAAIARTGAKPGCRKLYGIDVPISFWPRVSREAQKWRNGKPKHTLASTREFVKHAVRILNEQA